MRKLLLAAPAAAMLTLAATTSILIQIVALTSPRLPRYTFPNRVAQFSYQGSEQVYAKSRSSGSSDASKGWGTGAPEASSRL